ncbi:PadR family transcriptional regulator [Clostridium sediminicola]|uniref:PadR family transcriptional regulator n=1 Tax=Clostridium sediminicola TaxID=3114879 RepID=UPI0031F217D0
MKDNSQLVRGILEGCILKIISNGETYGYEIVEKLKTYGFKNCTEGTVYPILIRLEKNKKLSFIKKASPLGPKRKYYSLTDIGNEDLNDFNSTWNELKICVDGILNN